MYGADPIACALGTIAVVLALCGLILIVLESRLDSQSGRLRRRMTADLRHLAAAPLAEVPGCAVAHATRAVDRFVAYWYEQSERNILTAGAFTLIVFIAIPVAAIMNWLRGGSPTLLIVLLACAAGMTVLAVLSETKSAPAAARALSSVLFGTIFLGVPIYVFISLTGHALAMPIGIGIILGILLTPLLYLICHSAVLLGAGTAAMPVPSRHASTFRRIVTLIAAVVPFAYVGTFVAFLIWHLAEPGPNVPSTWRTLLVAGGGSALAAAAAIRLAEARPRPGTDSLVIRLGAGVAVSAGLAAIVALGIEASGGAPLIFALMPFAASAGLIAAIGIALLMRLVMAFFGPVAGITAERPYRVTGVVALILAGGAGWASAL